MTAQERLREWLLRSRLTQRGAARVLGFHYTHFNQILNGRRNPGVKNAIKIQRLTGVPVDCWLPTDDPQSARIVQDADRIGQ